MSETTPSWADFTFNPWIYGLGRMNEESLHLHRGATKMLTPGAQWGKDVQWRRTAPSNWRLPLAWNDESQASRRRSRVFCASLCDVFEDRPELVTLRSDLFDLIRRTPGLDWLLVTRQPENITKMLPTDWKAGWHHVWLGCPAENQDGYDQRIDKLLAVPSRIHFLVADPLIGSIRLSHGKWDALDWLVVGGESGPRFRAMDVDWARQLRDGCADRGIAFFFNRNSGLDPNRVSTRLDGELHRNWPKGRGFPRGRPKHSSLSRPEQKKIAVQRHRSKYKDVPVSRKQIARIDELVGKRGRSKFIEAAIDRELQLSSHVPK